MVWDSGSVSIEADETVTGAGYALDLYNAIVAAETAVEGALPDPLVLPTADEYQGTLADWEQAVRPIRLLILRGWARRASAIAAPPRAAVAPARLPAGGSPAGLWHFDGDVADSSGGGLDFPAASYVYLEGAPTLQGLDLGISTSSLVRPAYDPALALAGVMTIEVLARRPALASGAYISLVAFGSGVDSAHNTFYDLLLLDSGQLDVAQTYGAAVFTNGVSSTRGVPAESLCYLAATRAADGVTWTYYINGQPAGSTVLAAPPDGGGSSVLALGDGAGSGLAPPGTVLLGLKITAAELSAAEIKAQYNGSLGLARGVVA